jgi:hypothetical protein
MNKRAVILLALGLVAILSIATGGSTALAATDPAAAAGDSWSMAHANFIREGIPMPIVDSSVDGWYQYLGGGKFITESGRTFFWSDGHFVNPDGTTMEIPASAKDHLLSLGIDHQTTAQDMAAPAARDLAPMGTPWTGDYLHSGFFHGQTYGHTGNQADINVSNRSANYMQYYGIGIATSGWPSGDTGMGFEVANQDANHQNTWIPTLHRTNPDTQWSYPNYAFNTTPGGYVWVTLKMGLQTNGYVRPYLNNVCIDWTGMYYGPTSGPVQIQNYTRGESAFEIASDNGLSAPHDPANHHSNIQTRGLDFATWSLQDQSQPVDIGSTWHSNLTNETYTETPTHYDSHPVYQLADWVITNWYDWMARP